jgi:hypothetical protein
MLSVVCDYGSALQKLSKSGAFLIKFELLAFKNRIMPFDKFFIWPIFFSMGQIKNLIAMKLIIFSPVPPLSRVSQTNKTTSNCWLEFITQAIADSIHQTKKTNQNCILSQKIQRARV